MTDRTQIYEIYKKVIKLRVFKFSDLLAIYKLAKYTKFQLSISTIMPAFGLNTNVEICSFLKKTENL